MSYPYDEATGSISFSEGEVFFTCPIEGGVPDGHCVDEMGKLSVKLESWSSSARILAAFAHDSQGSYGLHATGPEKCFA